MPLFNPLPTPESAKALITGDSIDGFLLYPEIFDSVDQNFLMEKIKSPGFLSPTNHRGLMVRDTGVIPDWCDFVHQRLIELHILEVTPTTMFFILYPPGTSFDRHKDSMKRFGPTIAGLSLGGTSELRFKSEPLTDDERESCHHLYQETGQRGKEIVANLPPGSVYTIRNYARYEMAHTTKPIDTERIAITMRD